MGFVINPIATILKYNWRHRRAHQPHSRFLSYPILMWLYRKTRTRVRSWRVAKECVYLGHKKRFLCCTHVPIVNAFFFLPRFVSCLKRKTEEKTIHCSRTWCITVVTYRAHQIIDPTGFFFLSPPYYANVMCIDAAAATAAGTHALVCRLSVSAATIVRIRCGRARSISVSRVLRSPPTQCLCKWYELALQNFMSDDRSGGIPSTVFATGKMGG